LLHVRLRHLGIVTVTCTGCPAEKVTVPRSTASGSAGVAPADRQIGPSSSKWKSSAVRELHASASAAAVARGTPAGEDNLIGDLGPSAAAVALQDRFADRDLVVAILERGVSGLAFAAGGDVRVDLHEQVVRSLGVALGVAAGVVRERARLGAHQRAVL